MLSSAVDARTQKGRQAGALIGEPGVTGRVSGLALITPPLLTVPRRLSCLGLDYDILTYLVGCLVLALITPSLLTSSAVLALITQSLLTSSAVLALITPPLLTSSAVLALITPPLPPHHQRLALITTSIPRLIGCLVLALIIPSLLTAPRRLSCLGLDCTALTYLACRLSWP